MPLDSLISGAGAFTALSALPMLLGLALRESSVAVWLRRTAIVLALALPLLFMLYIATNYLANPEASVFFDFTVNHNAATALYGQGQSPYTIAGAYSFPFPTFYLYWVLGGFGQLIITQAWIIWWIVNLIVWALCTVILWRSARRYLPRLAYNTLELDMLRYVAVAIPAIVTLWQGQTALFILAGLIALHLGSREDSRRWLQFIGGAGLGWATLIKPQLALIGLGIAVWSVLALYNNRRAAFTQVVVILAGAVVTALLLIALTLILPGGVTLDTYRAFVSQALPQVARPDADLVIGSPAYVAGWIAFRLGASDQFSDLIANGVTVLVVAAAIAWTIRQGHTPLTVIAASWAVWAMVAPRVAWTWYAAWCLPFFWLAIRGQVQHVRRRSALVVILLALLNLQFSVLLIAFCTIALFIYLTWTSFALG